MSETITIRRPDDWHVHLRDGAMLAGVLHYTARQFARAIVMPNLVQPVVTAAEAEAYRGRIMAALPAGMDFTPLMTAYLTGATDPADIRAGHANGIFTAAKHYPAGATTNSASGVRDIFSIMPVLETMADIGMVLCVHGEVTDADVDIFDREAVFIERTLIPLAERLPELKIVFEHITTAQGVAFVESAGPNVAATITPHHLYINRNAMLVGGIQPHMYCLPVPKRERHRLALRRAATGGSAKFFLGTDSAPHSRAAKEAACGCAGIFNAPHALESYLAVFEEDNALARFEGFASLHGPAFYGLPVNDGTITLERSGVTVNGDISIDRARLVPFHSGEQLAWRLLPG